MKLISGSMLYDAVHCPHRVSMDAFEDAGLRDEPDAFVELLWENGLRHEEAIVATLGADIESLLDLEPEEKEARTRAAIARRAPLIYNGRLSHGDLVGEPDLLRLNGEFYVAGDIKSGSGFSGDEEAGKLKKQYAAQVAHYTHLLELCGFSDGSREAFVVDRHGNTVPYILNAPMNTKTAQTWWDYYQALLLQIREILALEAQSHAALSAVCGLCHWSSRCDETLREIDDLSLIPDLGRSKRDSMFGSVQTVAALAATDVEQFVTGKKTAFAGIGPDTLRKFKERAILLSTPGAAAYKKSEYDLPATEREIFFDVETDPFRDICYLHGFVERNPATGETKFLPCFARAATDEAEEIAFKEAWDYLSAQRGSVAVYYYSSYERTTWTKLAEKYPNVCSKDDVLALFGSPHLIDLMAVVTKHTEWPTNSRSIKVLAKYLGFRWRDAKPSGAGSIEWFNRYIETADIAIKQRILDYNEDDCLATGVLLDGLKRL
jgi:predicted RecB family nuclease